MKWVVKTSAYLFSLTTALCDICGIFENQIVQQKFHIDTPVGKYADIYIPFIICQLSIAFCTPSLCELYMNYSKDQVKILKKYGINFNYRSGYGIYSYVQQIVGCIFYFTYGILQTKANSLNLCQLYAYYTSIGDTYQYFIDYCPNNDEYISSLPTIAEQEQYRIAAILSKVSEALAILLIPSSLALVGIDIYGIIVESKYIKMRNQLGCLKKVLYHPGAEVEYLETKYVHYGNIQEYLKLPNLQQLISEYKNKYYSQINAYQIIKQQKKNLTNSIQQTQQYPMQQPTIYQQNPQQTYLQYQNPQYQNYILQQAQYQQNIQQQQYYPQQMYQQQNNQQYVYQTQQNLQTQQQQNENNQQIQAQSGQENTTEQQEMNTAQNND